MVINGLVTLIFGHSIAGEKPDTGWDWLGLVAIGILCGVAAHFVDRRSERKNREDHRR